MNELFRLIILANELDNNLKLAFRFSDPDGVRSGKSGWSFGVCQFDTRNNSQALKCLAACGFTADEIDGIVDQTISVTPFSDRLKAHSAIIAEYDEAQLSRCIFNALDFYHKYEIPVVDTAAILATADYINQYGSCGDGFGAYMKGLDRQLVAQDILDFKLKYTKYGREHPADCKRRYTNLMNVMSCEK
jgi:hypothetical protein